MKIRKITVTKEFANIKLDKYVKQLIPNISFSNLHKLFRTGKIRINNKRSKGKEILIKDDIVFIPEFCFEEFSLESTKKKDISQDKEYQYFANLIENSVIYFDDEILAINKPAGLSTQGGSKVKISVDDFLHLLKFEYSSKPKLVHRLDRDTSGVLLLARTTAAATKLGTLFKTRKIEKEYLALVNGIPSPQEGIIKNKLIQKRISGEEMMCVDDTNQGDTAETAYKVKKSKRNVALLTLNPHTGRKHQLRVHCSQSLGCPIIGDYKYGKKAAKNTKFADQMHLHAVSVTINGFYDNKPVYIEATPPDYLKLS